MKSQTEIPGPKKNVQVVSFLVVLLWFFTFCFLPNRLLIAALLFTLLMLFLSWISNSNAFTPAKLKSGNGAARQAKIRTHHELNDRFLEHRIQQVFTNIRTSDEAAYKNGLLEIQRLLSIRQNYLLNLTSNEKVS